MIIMQILHGRIQSCRLVMLAVIMIFLITIVIQIFQKIYITTEKKLQAKLTKWHIWKLLKLRTAMNKGEIHNDIFYCDCHTNSSKDLYNY